MISIMQEKDSIRENLPGWHKTESTWTTAMRQYVRVGLDFAGKCFRRIIQMKVQVATITSLKPISDNKGKRERPPQEEQLKEEQPLDQRVQPLI